MPVLLHRLVQISGVMQNCRLPGCQSAHRPVTVNDYSSTLFYLRIAFIGEGDLVGESGAGAFLPRVASLAHSLSLTQSGMSEMLDGCCQGSAEKRVPPNDENVATCTLKINTAA